MLSQSVSEVIDPLTEVSCPHKLPRQSLHENNENIEQRSCTKNAFNDCLSLTKGSVYIMKPEYSLLIQGFKGITSERSGGYLSGYEQGIGTLMLMAAPVYEPIRLIGSIFGTTLGILGTMVTGIAYGTTKVGECVTNATRPSADELERQKMTNTFIQGMHLFLNDHHFTNEYKQLLIENPVPLIGLNVIYVAFKSRKINGHQLETAFGIISERTIENQPAICRRYFNDVCLIKDNICLLNLFYNDQKAWQQLAEGYEALVHNIQYNGHLDQSILVEIINRAKTIGELFSQDPYFTDAWKESHQ